MADKKTTIYDLAESLHISVGTVYRALHGTGRISPSTKEKVLNKAAEMNFEFNPSAQRLSRAPITIGVILCCPIPEFLNEIYSGISYEFSELAQYKVISDIRIMPNKNAEDCSDLISEALLSFIEKKYDGVILFLSGSHSPCSDALSALAEAGIPMVCLVNDIPFKNRISFVSADGTCAGRIAAELLSLSCAKKNIALLTGDNSVYIHKLNLSGFMDEAKNGIFSSIDIYEHQDKPDLIRKQLDEIFKHTPSYQGLYITSASSIYAYPILLKLNKNHKVNIITTDLFSQTKKPLNQKIIMATIFQNPFLQGRKAVKAMYNYLQNHAKQDVVMIPPQIVMHSNVDLYHVITSPEKDL